MILRKLNPLCKKQCNITHLNSKIRWDTMSVMVQCCCKCRKTYGKVIEWDEHEARHTRLHIPINTKIDTDLKLVIWSMSPIRMIEKKRDPFGTLSLSWHIFPSKMLQYSLDECGLFCQLSSKALTPGFLRIDTSWSNKGRYEYLMIGILITQRLPCCVCSSKKRDMTCNTRILDMLRSRR